MVKADPNPVERVRWTSTRSRDPNDDDLDADSIMRGGVCLGLLAPACGHAC